MSAERIPVTILTGFLGSGKTTLLNRILHQAHGQRIAVIENEYGAEGIDNELLVQDRDEQIVTMNNGCICCTVRGDLIRILGELAGQRSAGLIAFDRVIIETTGLADPAPVAQTFFVDDNVLHHYLLDAVVTVVDAVHAGTQLVEHHEAQEQVGFADRILISKTDLVEAPQIERLSAQLHRLNPRAPVAMVNFGQCNIEQLLDVHGFNLDDILQIEPGFLNEDAHEHDEAIGSFVFRSAQAFRMDLLESFLADMVERHGRDMLRYKGILNVVGQARRIVFQGVHMLSSSDFGRPWLDDEARESVLVFIGRRLPREAFEAGLEACLASHRQSVPVPSHAA
jgi:G3E family GTPase